MSEMDLIWKENNQTTKKKVVVALKTVRIFFEQFFSLPWRKLFKIHWIEFAHQIFEISLFFYIFLEPTGTYMSRNLIPNPQKVTQLSLSSLSFGALY